MYKKYIVLAAMVAMGLGAIFTYGNTMPEVATGVENGITCKCRIFHANICSARGWSARCAPSGTSYCSDWGRNCG